MTNLSNCLLACVILFLGQKIAAKSLGVNCGIVCKEKDLDAEDGYFASGSAVSSQFLLPDGSVVTNSKETSISSDGIKQTYHELKKEADRFVQTGSGVPVIHNGPSFANVPNLAAIASVPKLPTGPAVAYYPSVTTGGSHSSYSETNKEHELKKKIINSLSPPVSSHYDQFQGQNNLHVNSNSHVLCDVCSQHAGQSGDTSSYNTIIGNVPAGSSSSYQKYESSSHKNSTQMQPILISNLKPNTFTTNVIDFNSNLNQNGPVPDSHIKYSDNNQVKMEEYGSEQKRSSQQVSNSGYVGPISHPSSVVVRVSGPGAVNSQSYQKQQSSSHVQSSGHPVPLATTYVPVGDAEIMKNHDNVFRSPVLVGGVPQNVPLDHQGGSYHSSSGHSYYSSSSSSSSSKTENSADGSAPIVIHNPPQTFSSSHSYSNNGGSRNTYPSSEYYYNGNKIHGASSSIYDQAHAQSNSNAETLCDPCTSTYVSGTPVRNSYGIATSFSSHSSTINGKTTENREAAVAVNDNGKLDSYHVKS